MAQRKLTRKIWAEIAAHFTFVSLHVACRSGATAGFTPFALQTRKTSGGIVFSPIAQAINGKGFASAGTNLTGITRIAPVRALPIKGSLRHNNGVDQFNDKLKAVSIERLLSALVELNHQALDIEDENLLLNAAAEAVVSCLGLEFCSIWERMPDNSILLRAGSGWNNGRIGRQVERNNSTPALRVVLSHEPVIINDLAGDSRFPEPSLLSEHGVVSSINVPIHSATSLCGVLGAHTRAHREFHTAELNALQLIAQTISAGLPCRGREHREPQDRWLRAEQLMALGQIAAGMAHELRNPLTSIKGLIQVNQREFEDRGAPVHDFQVIEQEIRRMERSLQAFLDFARPPRPERHRLDLALLVERVAALVQGRAKKQHVSIEFTAPDVPAQAEVDADQVQQLLLNLLLNALDAMPSGGSIRISLRHAGAATVEIEVADTGPGIAPHILPVIFDTFVTDKESGVGLGLPVSRRIAEDHRGS